MVTSATYHPYEGSMRLFLVFAPDEDDDRFDGQLLCLNDFKEGFIRRNLVLYEVLADGESRVAGEPLSEVDADALRMTFAAAPGEFLAVLADEDGVELRRWRVPVPPGELFHTVDTLRRSRPMA